MTLSAARRQFIAHRSPQVIAAAVVIALVIRLRLDGWTLGDVAVVAGILGFEPFTEWLIHVFLLHWKPRTVFGRQVDPLAARKHRAHHRDPKDLELVFVPMPIVLGSLVFGPVLWAVMFRDATLTATATVTGFAMLFVYEWTHYLIHTPYRPRSRYYRYIWRAHRLHHYRNEHYWFGVTIHAADHVLRTFPAKDAVPLSETARDLGVPEAAA